MIYEYNKIVVPLDGSPQAEQILDQLAFLGPAQTKSIVLVNAVVPSHYAVTTPQLGIPNIIAYMVAGANEYLSQVQEKLQTQGYTVSTHVMEDDAALSIVNLAKTEEANLIAMTTHGRSGLARLALGSITERVIHTATAPLLLVRPDVAPTTQLRRLLVPLDGSQLAEDALHHAVALAKMSGASILLMQATHELDAGNKRILFANEEEAEEAMSQWLQDADTYLQSIKHQLLGQDIAVETLVKAGEPAAQISQIVADRAIDLVVMSTHGRTGVRRWMYGSVANKVLRGLTHPLLLIPSRAAAEDA